MSVDVRPIAFYLPQFHPVPENDEWWGTGFTEWRNVTRAKPRFFGHYQPHLPADVGFYDLRVPEVRQMQADLARRYGIYGFCYYHYWFGGRRILERPFNDVLASGEPDFPFCLCWANENWTRVWDGGNQHVLLGQNHSSEDDRAHIHEVLPAFQDERYIRINDKPLYLVYRTELLPNAAQTAEIWREEAHKAGIGDIYLARVEQFVDDVDPTTIGFDAAVEFAPSGEWLGTPKFRGFLPSLLAKLGLLSPAFAENNVIPYEQVTRVFMNKAEPDFKRFHCVSPMWDNSARRKKRARILVDSTPGLYERWLKHTIARTRKVHEGDERIVFLNAWNEWAEGCHLEPDLKWGHAYLEATQRALAAGYDVPKVNAGSNAGAPTAEVSALKQLYWQAGRKLRGLRDLAAQLSCPGRFSDKDS